MGDQCRVHLHSGKEEDVDDHNKQVEQENQEGEDQGQWEVGSWREEEEEEERELVIYTFRDLSSQWEPYLVLVS